MPALTLQPVACRLVRMATGRSPKLAALRAEIDANTARLRRLASGLDDNAWRRQPAPGRWSAAECVQHLNMSSRLMIPRMREAVRAARERGHTRPVQRLDVMGWLLLRSLEPPSRSRFKTTEDFTPPSVEPRDRVLVEWDALQEELAALVAEAEGVNLSRARVTSPFNSRVRYNAYSALRVTLAHQRRHLWQAERAIEGPTG